MSVIRGYRDLIAWQKSMDLADGVLDLADMLQRPQTFGLVDQMRRAAVSIPSNVAEGQARHATGKFIQFISHAEGSAAELDTQIILSVELGFCAKADAIPAYELIDEIRRMLNALRRKLAGRSG